MFSSFFCPAFGTLGFFVAFLTISLDPLIFLPDTFLALSLTLVSGFSNFSLDSLFGLSFALIFAGFVTSGVTDRIGILLDRLDETFIEVWDELDVSEASLDDLCFVSSIIICLYASSVDVGAAKPTLDTVDDTCELHPIFLSHRSISVSTDLRLSSLSLKCPLSDFVFLYAIGEESCPILSSLRVICATSLTRGVLVLTGIWLVLLLLEAHSFPIEVDDSLFCGFG